MTGALLLSAALGFLSVCGPALAQSPASPGASSNPGAAATPNPNTTIPEKIEPRAPGAGSAAGDNLSEHLDRTDGVIHPGPNRDPEIQVTPPNPEGGTMPVIPPPGSPGGDPTVQPK